ncbi:hypothetical protein [Kamptonema formosum]|uniref:hypothetical protein n=1 Tax=Kamptonema formosum TaxID=331992 RepID=UPI00037F30AF|nr:hypothetical protein [Oscillatoria sp. PCC 10802]
MSYAERTANHIAQPPVVNAAVVDYHDRVRWGPIFAGIVVAISTQLILSALGAAIGLSVGAAGSDARAVGTGLGIWSIISLLIALFLGSWVMARTCGPMNSKTAMLNGAILWATTLAVSAWLLASGVSGAFGVVASNAGEILNPAQVPGGADLNAPNIDAVQARNIARNSAQAAWGFIFGSLLGLIASLIGASLGARKPHAHT